MTQLKPCPECGSDNLVTDSSGSIRLSWVECNDCNFQFRSGACEENIPRHWNKMVLDRAKGEQP